MGYDTTNRTRQRTQSTAKKANLDWAQHDVGVLAACKMIIHHLSRLWTNKRRALELALTAL